MNEVQAIRKNDNRRLREEIQRSADAIRKSTARIAQLRRDIQNVNASPGIHK